MARRLTAIVTKEVSLTDGDETNSGAANDDARILFRKNAAQTLQETDMPKTNDEHEGQVDENTIDDGEEDEEFTAFADEHGDDILAEFDELEPEEQAAYLVGLNYGSAVQEDAIQKAAEIITGLSENVVPREKYEKALDTLKASADYIEKMKRTGNAAIDDGGVISDIRKSLMESGAEIDPATAERLSEVEKTLAKTARKEAIAKATTYGFGKAEDVADLETSIRKALGDKAGDTYAAQIKQAGVMLRKSKLLTPIGEDPVEGDADSLVAKAKGGIETIMKANPNLTYAQAQSQYWAANPAEYRARQERRADAA